MPTKLIPQSHILRNQWGWVLIYQVIEANTVKITKRYRGLPAGELLISRQEARDHYAAQLRAGFVAKDTTF